MPGERSTPLEKVLREAAPGLVSALRSAGLVTLEALTARGLGEAITDHRSSWVRRLRLEGREVFVKTYRYASLADRLRGILRTTALAPSRALREHRALRWLNANGFESPAPLAVFEQRRLALLRVAVLVTEGWRWPDLAVLLPGLAPRDRERCLSDLDDFVARLHAAGFRDRNLDARNLLVWRRDDGACSFAKIDSPRHRIVARGRGDDRLARADRARLEASVRGLRASPAPGPSRAPDTCPRST